MKQILLLIIICVLPGWVGAQQHATAFDKDNYRLDTLRVGGEVIPKQRYAIKYLERFTTEYGKQQTTESEQMHKLEDLQRALDQISGYMVSNTEAYVNIKRAGETIDFLKQDFPVLDYSNYEKELSAYKKIDDARFEVIQARKKKVQQVQDEKLAKERAEQKRVTDSIEDIASSKQRIIDSTNDAIAEREEKIIRKQVLKKYGPVNGKAINEGNVLLGMTKDMCFLAWGAPETTNKSTSKGMITEKWYYEYPRVLVFKNGKVTMINE